VATAYFLIKSEPTAYSFDQLVADGKTAWTGVRNFAARNTLRAMKKGDGVLFYHSSEGKAVVGVARVVGDAYADPTQDPEGEDWSAVDIEPVRALKTPVTLDEMRAHPVLGKMVIFKQTRLSVVAVTKEEFDTVGELGKKKPTT
jgi:predicted RNA-binding protein with PUA-like domain